MISTVMGSPEEWKPQWASKLGKKNLCFRKPQVATPTNNAIQKNIEIPWNTLIANQTLPIPKINQPLKVGKSSPSDETSDRFPHVSRLLSAKNVTLLRVLTDLQALLAARCLRAAAVKTGATRSWKNQGNDMGKSWWNRGLNGRILYIYALLSLHVVISMMSQLLGSRFAWA